MMQVTSIYFLLLLVLLGLGDALQGHLTRREISNLRSALTMSRNSRQACDDRMMCRSKWGYCGSGPTYCSEGCTAGPCANDGLSVPPGETTTDGHDGGDIINGITFACAFNSIDARTTASRLNGLHQSGWTPTNRDEAAVFLAHVFHETDGLKTLREYCAPGCGSNYAASWCGTEGKSDKLYYGRGWFQLSWPCNYYAAGQALGVDLLSSPDLVEQQESLAVTTALWFYRTNRMEGPARRGDFAATTRIINGPVECDGGSGDANQRQRVETYKRIRQCFGLGKPTMNPMC